MSARGTEIKLSNHFSRERFVFYFIKPFRRQMIAKCFAFMLMYSFTLRSLFGSVNIKPEVQSDSSCDSSSNLRSNLRTLSSSN